MWKRSQEEEEEEQIVVQAPVSLWLQLSVTAHCPQSRQLGQQLWQLWTISFSWSGTLLSVR